MIKACWRIHLSSLLIYKISKGKTLEIQRRMSRSAKGGASITVAVRIEIAKFSVQEVMAISREGPLIRETLQILLSLRQLNLYMQN